MMEINLQIPMLQKRLSLDKQNKRYYSLDGEVVLMAKSQIMKDLANRSIGTQTA
ncbi:MAG: hypothetical protein HFI78_00010 [Lachnospiraceae bacterium]|nr:hypothetical protein [Lachnospiraceae bacterium]